MDKKVLDNTGSTNKNCYFMGWIMELVTESVLDYNRVSFMLASHTKFDVDCVFQVQQKHSTKLMFLPQKNWLK